MKDSNLKAILAFAFSNVLYHLCRINHTAAISSDGMDAKQTSNRSLEVVFISYGIWPAYLMTSIPYIGPGYDVAVSQVNEMYADQNIRFRLVYVASSNVKACPDQPAFVDDVSSYFYRNVSVAGSAKPGEDVFSLEHRHMIGNYFNASLITSPQPGTRTLPVLLYAGCFEFDTLAQLGREWNMLTVLTGLTFEGFRNRDRYPTSITLGHFNYQNYVLAVAALLKRHSWRTVCLLYDISQQIPFNYNVYKKLNGYLRSIIIPVNSHGKPTTNQCEKVDSGNHSTVPGSTRACPSTRRVQLFTYPHNASTAIDYADILDDITSNCRVVIISSTPLVTREILVQTFRQQRRYYHEYVWISVELPENPLGLTRWEKGSTPTVANTTCANQTQGPNNVGCNADFDSDKEALAAFSTASLFQVVNCIEHDAALTNSLRTRFMNLTKTVYNTTYKPGSRPSESTMTAFAAVHMVASVINESLQHILDENMSDGFSMRDEADDQWPFGRVLAENFLDREFPDGAKGHLFVDRFGERQVPICLAIFDPRTKEFQKVQIIDHTSPDLRSLPNTSFELVWKTPDGNTPLNEPVCGFRGEKCSAGSKTGLLIALLAVTGCLCTGIVIFVVIIRYMWRNGWNTFGITEPRWRLDPSQLEFQMTDHTTRSRRLIARISARPTSASALQTASSAQPNNHHKDTPDSFKNHSPTSALQKHMNKKNFVIFYHGIQVWADVFYLQPTQDKSSANQKTAHTRFRPKDRARFPSGRASRLINQAWSLSQHNLNINTMIGIHSCPIIVPEKEPESSVALIMVTDYCQRGNVQELLNSSVRLDWDMLTSLLMDLTQAVWLVHTSPFLRHGHLRPEVCLIDKRLSLKLAKVGFYDILGADQWLSVSENPHSKLPDVVAQPGRDIFNVLDRESFTKWTAPELQSSLHDLKCCSMVDFVTHPQNTPAADMYALGHVFEFLLKSVLGQELISKPAEPIHIEPERPSESAGVTETVRRTYTIERNGTRNTFRSKRVTAKMQLYKTVSECHDSEHTKRPTIQKLRAIMLDLKSGHTGQNVLEILMKRMSTYTSQLEDAVAERSEGLLNERRLCDELLQEMFPVEIIRRLRLGEEISPESYGSISIMFTYLSGFSDFSIFHSESPLILIAFLNEAFGQFDDTLNMFRIYKVETVGDSYMVASGLPQPYDKHAWDLCLASCALRSTFKTVLDRRMTLQQENLKDKRVLESPLLNIQMGINTGPCVAGVVGLKRPRYCLFGDTVNTASRLASHSEPGRIQLSCRTYQQLALIYSVYGLQPLDTSERGYVLLKGKGKEITYWLND